MTADFQRVRRAIEAATAEQVESIMAVLPAPIAIPATYVPPSQFIKNAPTWSILIDHISETFVFIQGHRAHSSFHTGKYLEFTPEEWLAAEKAHEQTRPGMSGLILGVFPEDALDLDTWTETRSETPLPPGIEQWNPYHEVAFADSPNGDESEALGLNFPIPAPQWAGGTYRVVRPDLTRLTDTRMDTDTPDWALREADRLNVVRSAHNVIEMKGAFVNEATLLARHALALLEDIAFLSPDATPAVNPVPDTDGDE